VLEIRDSTVGRAAMGRANAGAKKGSTLGCARSSISAVLRRSIVVEQTAETFRPVSSESDEETEPAVIDRNGCER